MNLFNNFMHYEGYNLASAAGHTTFAEALREQEARRAAYDQWSARNAQTTLSPWSRPNEVQQIWYEELANLNAEKLRVQRRHQDNALWISEHRRVANYRKQEGRNL